jgi:hypothetical protein
MHDIRGLQILSVLFVLIAIALIATSVIGAAMLTVWAIIATILKLFVRIPWALLHFGLGALIRLSGALPFVATSAARERAVMATLRRSRNSKR